MKTQRKRKLTALSLLAAIVLCASAWASAYPSQTTHTASASGLSYAVTERTFNSVDDFSHTQGQRNWYYMYASTSGGAITSIQECAQFQNKDLKYWGATNEYTLIGTTTTETPENKLLSGQLDEWPVIGWKAPAAGTVTLTVTARNGNSAIPFDGLLLKNNTEITSWTIQAESDTKTYEGQTVAKDDYYYFAIKPTGNTPSGGEVYSKISIVYTAIANTTAVSALAEAIDALPAVEEVALANAEAVTAAYNTAAAMSGVERSYVAAEKMEKLNAVYSKVCIWQAEAAINALPEEITLASSAAIEAARQAYDALTDAEKATISEETLKKLTDAEEEVTRLIAEKMTELIVNIPDSLDASSSDHRALVYEAKAALDAIAGVRNYINATNLKKLDDAVAVFAEAEKAATIVFNSMYGFPTLIDSMPQGGSNWYYEFCAFGSDTYTLLPDNVNYHHVGDEPQFYGSSYNYAMIFENSTHAGGVGDVSRTFVAPYTGVINISGFAYKAAGGCDVEVKVLQNTTDLFADSAIPTVTAAIEMSNRITFEKKGITVTKGDNIRFVYHAPRGNAYAETRSVVEVEYTEMLDDTLALVHSVTLNSEIPSTTSVGQGVDVKTGATFAPAGATEEIRYVVYKSGTAAYENKNARSQLVQAYVDENGYFRALVPGEYRVCAVGADAGAILGSKTITVTANDARTNNSLVDFDSSFTVLPQLGKGNWYYMHGEVDNPAEFAYCESIFESRLFQGGATYTLMGAQENIIDESTNYPVRAWKAPSSGTVVFDIFAYVNNEPALAMDIYKNEESILKDWKVSTHRGEGKSFTFTVDAGDFIYVQIKKSGDTKISGVSFYTTMNATYTEITGASAEKVAVVERYVDTLPAVGEATDAHKRVITAAYAQYLALSDLEKSFVDEAKATKVVALNSAMKLMEVEALIEALPATITLGDEAKVNEANSAYELLTATEKERVTDAAKLTAAVETIRNLKADKEALDAVYAAIDLIPVTVTRNDKATVVTANRLFTSLTEGQKAMVESSYKSRLDAAVAAIVLIDADVAAAEEVEDSISSLPAVSAITLLNAEAVAAANTAYAALTDAQKAYVTNYADLTVATARIEVLQTAKTAADSVAALIAALPEAITLDDAIAVASARAAYDVLSADGKAFITALATLELAEATIERLESEAPATTEPSSCGSQMAGVSGGAAIVLLAICLAFTAMRKRSRGQAKR